MANFKARFTYQTDNEADFVQVKTDDASLETIKDGRWARNRALLETMDDNANDETSPSKEDPGSITTLDSGKKQYKLVWTGFGSQADATTFAKAFVTAPDQPTVSAYMISKDIRTKIEVLDNSDAVVATLHDNTNLERKTRVVDLTDADPFFIGADDYRLPT